MTVTLHDRIQLSLQRALVGEIAPEMQVLAVHVSPAQVHVRLIVDAGSRPEVAEDFAAGAMTQVVADFCWPERGDPKVEFECFDVPPGHRVELPAGYTVVFERQGVNVTKAMD